MAANGNSLALPLMSQATSQGPEEIITVEVGPEKKKYGLHGSFLAHHTEYFQRALRGSWKETQDRFFPLWDVEPTTFDVFVDWLYTQRLPPLSEWKKIPDPTSLLLQMLKVYVLGDRLQALSFKRLVNRVIVEFMADSRPGEVGAPYYGAIIYAFDNLPEDSPILNLIVDTHCLFWRPEADVGLELELRAQLPYEFLCRVMVQYGNLAKNWDFTINMNPCLYHEHASEEEEKECQVGDKR